MDWLYIKEAMLPQCNEKKFIDAYENYRQPIYEAVCNLITKQAAEDIVHDVFIKLWAKKDILDEINDLHAFLWVSARNQCINEMKRQKCLTAIQQDAAENKMNVDCPDEIVIRRETEQCFQLAIQSLPPQRKKIFLLSWYEGLNTKQIADHLHISFFTVKASLQTARHDIRLFMARHTDFKRKRVMKKLKKVWSVEVLKQVA